MPRLTFCRHLSVQHVLHAVPYPRSEQESAERTRHLKTHSGLHFSFEEPTKRRAPYAECIVQDFARQQDYNEPKRQRSATQSGQYESQQERKEHIVAGHSQHPILVRPLTCASERAVFNRNPPKQYGTSELRQEC